LINQRILVKFGRGVGWYVMYSHIFQREKINIKYEIYVGS